MSMTVLQLITRAMQGIGALASGEVPTAAEANDGLLSLISIIDSLQTQPRTMYSVSRVTHAVTGSATYTIGVGAEIVRTRPEQVLRAALLYSAPTPDLEVPLAVLTDQQWQRLSDKDQTATIPSAVYYAPTNPLGTLYVYPVATDTTNSLVLYIPEPLSQVTALANTLVLPPGYERMLRYQLMLEMASEYGRPVTPAIAQVAQESLSSIKRMNLRPETLAVDPALLRRGGSGASIYTGDV